jgi:hypothetical protein
MVLGLEQGQVVRQVLDLDVLELDLHRRADVDLHGEHAFQRAAVFVEVDQVGGRVAVDPVLVMIASTSTR